MVNGLVSAELDQRVNAFDEALKALRAQISRWPPEQVLAVPDTSIFIAHRSKLEDLDFAAELGLSPGVPVAVLVPMVVVDELDRLKESKDRHVRWRAGYTLAVLDRAFAASTDAQPLQAGDNDLTVEILFDPPGHVRLPIQDDEIADRALSVQPPAARSVTLLTFDTGQSMRARAAGLKVRKLIKPLDDQPG